jgi:hypothetical protein
LPVLTRIFFALCLALTACNGGDKDADDLTPEGQTPGDCNDGADNDGDGLFDCDDDGCFGAPDCGDSGGWPSGGDGADGGGNGTDGSSGGTDGSSGGSGGSGDTSGGTDGSSDGTGEGAGDGSDDGHPWAGELDGRLAYTLADNGGSGTGTSSFDVTVTQSGSASGSGWLFVSETLFGEVPGYFSGTVEPDGTLEGTLSIDLTAYDGSILTAPVDGGQTGSDELTGTFEGSEPWGSWTVTAEGTLTLTR